MRNVATEPIENTGLRNNPKSTIGVAARDSTTTNATSAASPATSSHGTPWMSAGMIANSAPVTRTSPSGSRCPAPRDSATRCRSPTSTSTPMGRLIRKIARQPNSPVSAPPTTGPSVMASPETALKTPSALPRSGPSG